MQQCTGWNDVDMNKQYHQHTASNANRPSLILKLAEKKWSRYQDTANRL